PRANRRLRRALTAGEPGEARAFRRHRRRSLQADRAPRRRADARVHRRAGARADRPRQGPGDGRRRARGPRDPHFRGRAMIGVANGQPVSISGLGCHVPERVLTNEELSTLVDTSDEWIVTRTGIRERRIAAQDEALSDIALPACKDALEQAGVPPAEIDL